MPIIGHRPPYRHVRGDIHRLEGTFVYYDKKLDRKFTIAPGFEWDLGSVPSLIPDALVPDNDEMTYPSLLHDYLYRYGGVERQQADRMFRQMLHDEFKRAGAWFAGPRSWLAWRGVRRGGWIAWNKYRKGDVGSV